MSSLLDEIRNVDSAEAHKPFDVWALIMLREMGDSKRQKDIDRIFKKKITDRLFAAGFMRDSITNNSQALRPYFRQFCAVADSLMKAHDDGLAAFGSEIYQVLFEVFRDDMSRQEILGNIVCHTGDLSPTPAARHSEFRFRACRFCPIFSEFPPSPKAWRHKLNAPNPSQCVNHVYICVREHMYTKNVCTCMYICLYACTHIYKCIHTGDSDASTVDAALDILVHLVRGHSAALRPFAVFIKGILDYLDNLKPHHIRKLFNVLSMISISGDDGARELDDDVTIYIRKLLSSPKAKYMQHGIIGAVSAIVALSTVSPT